VITFSLNCGPDSRHRRRERFHQSMTCSGICSTWTPDGKKGVGLDAKRQHRAVQKLLRNARDIISRFVEAQDLKPRACNMLGASLPRTGASR
jgi:hypothetical protein